MNESELRQHLLARLTKLAERLPNGLLHRLVEDAQFFYDWNLKKKRARQSARISQFTNWKSKAEDKYWNDIKRQRG
jgi:hypothetical protein